MDTVRKLAILIVMIVPTFVGAGAVWDIFESWIAVLIWLVIMGVVAGNIVTGKLLTGGNSEA
ncbi:MAG: hypothetical protein ACQET7_09805 [Thermodesulfobacteriota bacterium]